MFNIPNTDDDRRRMLAALGLTSPEQLLRTVPPELPHAEPMLPPPLSELELTRHLRELAARNRSVEQVLSFLGAGAYEHYIPAALGELLGRSEFYTAYTPYQPELSQGTLQSIYEYQTMMAELTGLEVANASMYDGASALAEAALMALRITQGRRLLVSPWLHPHYRAVLRTYLSGIQAEVVELPGAPETTGPETVRAQLADDCAALIVQNPNFLGFLEPLRELGELMAAHRGLFIVAVNPIALGLLVSPGEAGADIAVGEGQPLGVPLSFGGPYVGFMATREAHLRQMPGRLVGATQDPQGQRGYVLALQTREQHIRRERATSNICTNQALCALANAIYLSLVGPAGLRQVAELNFASAHRLAECLARVPGCSLASDSPFFNEFPLRLPRDPNQVSAALAARGILGGLPLGSYYPDRADQLLICATETKTSEDTERFAGALEQAL